MIQKGYLVNTIVIIYDDNIKMSMYHWFHHISSIWENTPFSEPPKKNPLIFLVKPTSHRLTE